MDNPNGEALDQKERTDCSVCVSCTTFNILAPIYKRLNSGTCESEFRESWLSRNEGILARLLQLNSSIFCLQELWLANEELASMYEKCLRDAGYVTYKLARTNNRGDGLFTAVHQGYFCVLNYKELLFNDIGDRVAQLLHVELLPCFPQNSSAEIRKQALLVNTHLIFPHDSSYCFLRLQQVYKILEYIESYATEHQLSHVPVILCGDWNGSKRGHVYKLLLSQGFDSSYDLAHQSMNNDGNYAQKWISHRNHRGNICGVDFIWLRNPGKCRRPLKECYLEAIYGNIMQMVERQSGDPRNLFQTESSYMSYSRFTKILNEVGINGDGCDGLRDEDVKNLWEYLEADKYGLADPPNLNSSWESDPSFPENHGNEESETRYKQKFKNFASSTVGFNVKSATLYPTETENGMWPENYFLSDHAYLTVEFFPLKMQSKELLQ